MLARSLRVACMGLLVVLALGSDHPLVTSENWTSEVIESKHVRVALSRVWVPGIRLGLMIHVRKRASFTGAHRRVFQ